ncbi:MAG: oligosaccharide repeat unit polymerase [Maribacter sp.]|nr:oligosaccharide repeat unit polymerase [Maribacter sp.]
MKIKKVVLVYFGLLIPMLITTILFSYFGALGWTLLLSFLCFTVICLICKASLGRLNNLTFFFLLFFALYTYAPVLTVYYNVDTRNLFASATPASSCAFTALSTLALFSFTIPFVFLLPSKPFNKVSLLRKKRKYTRYALLFLILATFGEILNMYRAGGLGLLSQGKAVYQAEVGALFITIPSVFLLQIALFFLGLRLYLTYESQVLRIFRSKIVFLSIFLITPILLLYFSIGFRSPLLAIAIAFLIGFTYFISIKSINIKLLGILFVGYSALAILFGIRGQLKLLFLTGDWDTFNEYVFENKAYLKYYNPANNEFGASFMNYIKFHEAKESTPLLYGQSYLEGFIIAIPGQLLPFDKPQSIGYKFRDLYFKEYKENSRIAGTGFSSIMEAQWNFGLLGPFVVYFVVGSITWVIEYFRNRYRFLSLFPLFYAMVLPLAQSFHRSSSGFYVSYVLFLSFFLLFLFIIKRIIVFRKMN